MSFLNPAQNIKFSLSHWHLPSFLNFVSKVINNKTHTSKELLNYKAKILDAVQKLINLVTDTHITQTQITYFI